MKEFALQLKLKNNRLRERRLSLGLSQKGLSDAAGLSPSEYGRLENLKESPLNKKGEWRPTVLRLADFFKVTPSELFPDSVFDVVESETEMKLDGNEALLISQLPGLLLGDSSSADEILDIEEQKQKIDKALRRLSPRKEQMVRQYFGLNHEEREHTLSELGDKYDVTGERVRTILQQALARLRHPAYGLLSVQIEPVDHFEAVKRSQHPTVVADSESNDVPEESAELEHLEESARSERPTCGTDIQVHATYFLDVSRQELYGNDVERANEVEALPFRVVRVVGNAVFGVLTVGRDHQAWACNAAQLYQRVVGDDQ